MKSLGHENVRVLNGYMQDWKERGLPTSSKTIVRPATNYTPAFTDQFIANYSFVKSDLPQVIDARTVQVFEAGSIPNARQGATGYSLY
jgi:thiosulfate/3-mercaptopyruvate sulfurtransferase